MKIEVECYAGYKADERPLRFCLHGRWHEAGEILDRWHGPEDEYFKVRAGDQEIYILRRHRDGTWTLEAYRAG